MSRILGAVVSGVLLFLALPPLGFWPCAWFALVPLLLATRGKRFLIGFLLGALSLLITAQLSLSGFLYADRSIDGEPQWITLGCFFFGVVVSLATAVFGELKAPKGRHLVAWAALAVILEWTLLPTLPVTIALTQSNVTAAHFLASVGGIWVVAFLLWYVNAALTEAIVRRKVPWKGLAAGAVVLIAAGLWNHSFESEQIDAVLVQSDSPEITHLAMLSRGERAALAIWPEFGGLMGVAGGDSKRLKELSNPGPAFVTSFPDGASPLPHNAASLFFDGQESERYFKRKLFGGEKTMHREGDRAVAVPWRSTQVGLSICFDSCFPGMFRQTASPEVGFVAIPTIDPPAPHHWMAAMHAAFIQFRSAENGISILRSDGSAYSEAVDPSGNVVAVLSPGERVGHVRITTDRRWTLYRLVGDVFLFVLPLLVLWPLAIRIRGKIGNANDAQSADQAVPKD